ncbi:quinone oxidoreductase-like protein 2 isoform X8 [Castor canadensis]|uniref:Quinone oxidoreductase-like protein 2 isoform X8 n=2 Tax=Castor canadensis TaxID=51338 RepID=A0AC58KEZ3_CASCN
MRREDCDSTGSDTPGSGRRRRAHCGWSWAVPRPPFRSAAGVAPAVPFFLPCAGPSLSRLVRLAMAALVCTRWLPRSWLCRRPGQGCGRHYRAALCTTLKQPLAIEEVASRAVQPHEVRVDVHFCGINFADILVCRGQYQERPHLPFTPGMEFSGTVLETGADVNTVKEGDCVIGVSILHGMAEECITDQKNLWQVPEKVSLREAATLPISYGTAILALEHRAHTQPGSMMPSFM